jgi:hypothetical protein
MLTCPSSATTWGRPKPCEALLEPARLRRAAVVHVLPAPAHAVHLLRRVHHLEPRRERADQLAGLGRRPPLRAHDELHAIVGVPLAASDRGLPVALDGSEDLLAALVLDDLAHELAERMHVVAQRRVLDREKYAFAGHDRRTAGGERLIVCSRRCACYQTAGPRSLLPRCNRGGHRGSCRPAN